MTEERLKEIDRFPLVPHVPELITAIRRLKYELAEARCAFSDSVMKAKKPTPFEIQREAELIRLRDLLARVRPFVNALRMRLSPEHVLQRETAEWLYEVDKP